MVGVPHLKDVFYRMGLSNKDIVALSGGHTLVIYVDYYIFAVTLKQINH